MKGKIKRDRSVGHVFGGSTHLKGETTKAREQSKRTKVKLREKMAGHRQAKEGISRVESCGN